MKETDKLNKMAQDAIDKLDELTCLAHTLLAENTKLKTAAREVADEYTEFLHDIEHAAKIPRRAESFVYDMVGFKSKYLSQLEELL